MSMSQQPSIETGHAVGPDVLLCDTDQLTLKHDVAAVNADLSSSTTTRINLELGIV